MRRTLLPLSLLVLAIAAPPASATFPGRNGDIRLVTDGGSKYPRTNYFDLVRVRPSGRPAMQSLCHEAPHPGNPGHCTGISDVAVAPTGRELAMTSTECDSPDCRTDLPFLRVVGPGPSVLRSALPPGWRYRGIAWAPDGSALLVQRNPLLWTAPPDGLHLVGRDGSIKGELVTGDAGDPDWSSRWEVAFVRASNLWVRRRDGSLQQLTTNGAEQPSWSPDGRSIAFRHGCDANDRGPGCGVYAIPATGGPARLMARAGSQPVWSPDGRRIAFVRAIEPGLESIFAVTVKTRRVHRLVRGGLPGHRGPLGDGTSVRGMEWPARR